MEDLYHEYGLSSFTAAQSPGMLFELAYTCFSRHLFAAGRAAVRHAAALGADSARVACFIGNSHLLEGDVDAAIDHLEHAVSLAPTDVGLRRNLELARTRQPGAADTGRAEHPARASRAERAVAPGAWYWR